MSTQVTYQTMDAMGAAVVGGAMVGLPLPLPSARRREIPWLGGLLLLSIAIHVALVGGIGRGGGARRHKVRPPTMVTMEVMAPKPAPPAPVAEPEAPRAVKHAAPRVAARAKAPAAARPAAPPPEAETPADFSGVTLTNDGPGPGWASATGNGGAMNGPIGTPGAKVTGRSRAGALGGDASAAKVAGPPTVKLADLSSPPRAPVLNDVLERNYPVEARKRGVQGRAVLRVRVMPDGHVRDFMVLAESGGGFGDACRRTLRDSIWSPPLDQHARPVSTFVSYTCTFEVH